MKVRKDHIKENRILDRMIIATMVVVSIVMFAGSLGSAVDKAIVGKYLGREAIAATSIIMPVIGICSIISTIFGNGMQLILLEVIARGDKKRAVEVFTTSVLTVFLITSAISALLFLLCPDICRLIGLTGKYAFLEAQSVSYCRGYAIGIPFFSVALTINQSLQLDGDRMLGLLAVLAAAVVNICGDIVVIVVLHRGLFAVALVTSISNLAMFAIILCHYRPHKSNLLLFKPSCFRMKDAFAVVKRGIPNAILIASRLVQGFVINSVLLKIADELHVSAVSVMSSVNIVQASLLSGFFATVSVISGALAGEGNKKGLPGVMRKCFQTGAVLSVVLIAFALLFADLLPRIFISDEKVISYAALAIRITVLSVPLQMLSGVIVGMHQGLKYIKLSSIEYILRDIVIPSLCFVFFGYMFGSTGVYVAMIVAYALSFAVIVMLSFAKMRSSSSGVYNKLMLLKDSDVTYESYEGSAGTLDEVVLLSEEIREFCLKQNCNRRMAYLTALATEELCKNAIIHNRSDDDKSKHCIDVLFRKKDEGRWILRLRDDYRLFDPVEWLKRNEEESRKDPAHNIGLRMIEGLTEEMTYTQLMNMNNLIICIDEARRSDGSEQ